MRDRPKTYDKTISATLSFDNNSVLNKIFYSNSNTDKIRYKKLKNSSKIIDERFKNVYQMNKFVKPKQKLDNAISPFFYGEKNANLSESSKLKTELEDLKVKQKKFHTSFEVK